MKKQLRFSSKHLSAEQSTFMGKNVADCCQYSKMQSSPIHVQYYYCKVTIMEPGIIFTMIRKYCRREFTET